MAFTAIAESKFTTFFENLIKQGKVKTKEVSFYLGRAAPSTAANSELTPGGRDPSKFTGPVTQVLVMTQGYWQVALDSVTVNSNSPGPTTKGQATIDTGTTVVIAPTIAAVALFELIPLAFPIPLASGSPTETIYAYPCNTAAKYIPAITFAGTSFAINPLDFNLGVLTPTFAEIFGKSTLAELLDTLIPHYCVAAIIVADLQPTENLYVVGDTFLKNWYGIYNYVNAGGEPSVSFAKAV